MFGSLAYRSLIHTFSTRLQNSLSEPGGRVGCEHCREEKERVGMEARVGARSRVTWKREWRVAVLSKELSMSLDLQVILKSYGDRLVNMYERSKN